MHLMRNVFRLLSFPRHTMQLGDFPLAIQLKPMPYCCDMNCIIPYFTYYTNKPSSCKPYRVYHLSLTTPYGHFPIVWTQWSCTTHNFLKWLCVKLFTRWLHTATYYADEFPQSFQVTYVMEITTALSFGKFP